MLNATYWVVVLALLISIVELLRRKVLREKYAVVWLGLAFLLILGANFPERVNHLSRALGFQYLSNFVLFIFMILNLFISYRAYATDQQFEFKNPSFSGAGYSSHVLTIENQEYTRKKANQQAAAQAAKDAALAANSTTLQKFLNYLGEGVPGTFLHRIRRSQSAAEFHAICREFLDHDLAVGSLTEGIQKVLDPPRKSLDGQRNVLFALRVVETDFYRCVELGNN